MNFYAACSGLYTIKLTDNAGNSTEYFFTIKTSRPNGRLLTNGQEVLSGARTRFDARLTWTESGCTATVNGQPYTKGAMFAAEGDYTFVLLDSYGNSNSWTITIDKTAPVIELTSGGNYLAGGQITRYDVCYNWDDAEATATLNGAAVQIGGVATEEGEYTLIVTDDVGNKTSIVFIIDKTAKVGTLIANSTILSTGALTKYSVYYTWNGSSYAALLNGEPYTKGALITAEGDYTIELTDKAGNKSSISFTIDKTAPIGILYHTQGDIDKILQTDNATNGNVYFEWTESGCTATVNGQPYTKGDAITAEGNYIIILTDAAGNSNKYTFTIDKTAPTARARNASNEIINDNSITRFSIYFEWTESGCTATVNGQPYTKNTLLTETDVYNFILTDTVGNTTSITIEVYKLKPNAQIVPINNFGLPYLNDGFSVIWEEENCTATVNGQPYTKGDAITAEGDYTFILTNKVGVEFIENIIVDRTAPDIKIIDAAGNEVTGDVCLDYVYFEWSEVGCTATVNGEDYRAKTYLTKDGIYTLTLTDAAGNTATKTVRVARKKPTVTLEKTGGGELTNGGSTTDGIVIMPTSDLSASITVDGAEYELGTEINTVGTHTVVVTDEYGNVSNYTFTIKEATERTSSNPFNSLAEGSSVGTYILIGLLGALVIVCIVVPLIKTRRKGAFKNKLK